MSKCSDCICYEVCDRVIRHNADVYENTCKLRTDMETCCPYFKDKFKIIDLPCKVGSDLYYVDFAKCADYQGCKSTSCEGCGFSRPIVRVKKNVSLEFILDQYRNIGTLFKLSKEEAEKLINEN